MGGEDREADGAGSYLCAGCGLSFEAKELLFGFCDECYSARMVERPEDNLPIFVSPRPIPAWPVFWRFLLILVVIAVIGRLVGWW